MNPSTPSLFRLFQRSAYRKPLRLDANPDGGVETEVRSERERFAAAAVAFCLQHSPRFREHFWRTTCGTEGDPPKAPDFEVGIEPVHWADLRLTAQFSHRRTVWVIEFKIHADLADKQNPKHIKFQDDEQGYGALFHREEGRAKTELRYVVLGSKKLPEGEGRIDELNLRWHARRWRDLNAGAPWDDGLTRDLLQSLGDLGIASFRMNETKQVVVTGDFESIAKAMGVLEALADRWDLSSRSRSWRIDVGSPQPQHFNVGAYLQSPAGRATSRLQEALAARIGGAENNLAWIGYETGPTIPFRFRRSVWLYCDSLQNSEKVKGCLAGLADILPHQDGVIAANRPNSGLTDLEWFESILTAAAGILPIP